MDVARAAGRPGTAWILATVAVAAVGAYVPALDAFFVGDDFDFLRLSEGLDSPSRIFKHSFWGEYMPVFTLSFLLDRVLWDLDPVGFHLSSLVFHVLASLFVYALATTLTRGDRVVGTVCALLFAVHPVHDEAVIYIAARGHVMGGALLFCALTCHARYRLEGDRRFLVPGILALFVGLFSKESTILAPGLVLAMELFLHPDAAPGRALFDRVRVLARGVAPFASVAFAYLAARRFILDVPHDKVEGVTRFGWDWERLPAFFLMDFLPVPGTLMSSDTLEGLAIPVSLVVTGLVLWVFLGYRAERRHGGPGTWSVLLFSCAFFAISTLPFLLDALSFRRRYAYLGSFAACLFLAALLARLSRGNRGWQRPAAAILAVSLFAANALTLVDRSRLYAKSGAIARNVVNDLQARIVPGTETVKLYLLQLPYRVGGDAIEGAYLLHETDLRSATRFFARADRVKLETLFKLDWADDHTTETALWDQGTLFVKMTSRSDAAYRSLVGRVDDEEGDTDFGRMRVAKRDPEARVVVLQFRIEGKLIDPEPERLVLVYGDGRLHELDRGAGRPRAPD